METKVWNVKHIVTLGINAANIKEKANQIYEPILKLSNSLPLNIFTTN